MNVKLELPTDAAKRLLAALATPEGRTDFERTTGFKVTQAEPMPNEAQRRTALNQALYKLTCYQNGVPWDQLTRMLEHYDFKSVSESDVVSENCTKDEGRLHTQVGPATWLVVTWHRMPSGKFEVLAYAS